MQLILAEKPSVANNIAYALSANNKNDGYFEGNGYIITFAFGHLYELCDAKDYKDGFDKWELDKFPFIPSEFKYKVKDDRGIKKQVSIIKKLANREDVTDFIIATDADREGQLIAAVIIKELEIKKPIKRLWISSYTPKDILKGINNLLDYKDVVPLEKAGYCRQHMDQLFGINFTSLTTLKYGNGRLLNIGRVLLPTVNLVYSRDMEIESFKKENYYQIKTIFDSKGQQYEGLYTDDKEKTGFKNKEKLQKIQKDIDNKHGIILDKKSKQVSEKAPLLFNLTDLQGYITSKYNGFTSDKVLKIAQNLYENKYISYPRTASRHLNDTQIEEIEEIVNILSKNYPSDYNIKFKATKRVFDSSKIDSHPALTLTYIMPNLDTLTKDETIIYKEIEKRFLAQFMPSSKYQNIELITKISDYRFISKERLLVEKGWLKLYKDKSISKLSNLANLEENNISKALYSNVLEKETTPPKRYTEKTLLKAMETCGKNVSEDNVEYILKGYSIGTPATRSDIIKKIIDIGYVGKKGKSLNVTELGKSLVEVFPIKELLDTDFTGRIEKSLKGIEEGNINADVFMERMKKYTERSSNIIKNDSGFIIKENNNYNNDIVGKCPECGNDVIANKKAYGCSNWRNGCKFAIWYNQLEKLGMKKISKTNAKKLLNKEKIKLKLKSSRTGKDFECMAKLLKENDRWSIKLEFK